jgi:subtilase family serine protease
LPLAGVVHGVVSLHDFRPHTNFKVNTATAVKLAYTVGGGYELVVPGDLAKIYRLAPLFRKGITGQGVTIALIEDTDVYSAADWTKFRSTFGLSKYTSGAFAQVHPAPASGTNNCSDPGIVPVNELEATLDAQWASAGAPGATTEIAACTDTRTTFGGLIALENLLTSAKPPQVVSISYGECEPENGAKANAAYSATYQEAVTLGTAVFVSAGDKGAASCDADEANATHGISVSGFASTPYNVAVGGTDFGDTYAGTNATYWRANNTKTYVSALSYIPEIPWNDSCASALITTALGYNTPYGTKGACNSAEGEAEFLSTASGSGGPSGCATGKPAKSGVVGGTCARYVKPAWQSVYGNPADGVRDLPDVSLFAANGVWGHYLLLCDTDAADGATCSGTPSGWTGAGGTSFSSPIVAGIQALVVQSLGAPQGNPDPVYYAMGKKEYGNTGNSACSSTLGNAVPVSYIFHDVTLGDMDVNCTGSNNCYIPSGSYGVLSTSDCAYDPAYASTSGWDFATGLGTVDATKYVNTYSKY